MPSILAAFDWLPLASYTALLELSDYDKRVIKEGGAVNYLRNKLK